MLSSTKARRGVLLTGFGPFPGVPQNASGLLAKRLAAAARRRFSDVAVRAAVLPTEWTTAPRRLARLLDEMQPAVALHFGVSEKVNGFSIETRARNVRNAVCDAAGTLPNGPSVVEGQPMLAECTIPTRQIVERLQALRLPVALSGDAGAYLCNATLYHSLYWARGPRRRTLSGFIHIPASLAADSGAATGPLDWDSVLRGGLEIIAACLDEAAYVVSAGTSTSA